jgi:hypothetical protein
MTDDELSSGDEFPIEHPMAFWEEQEFADSSVPSSLPGRLHTSRPDRGWRQLGEVVTDVVQRLHRARLLESTSNDNHGGTW